MPEPSRQYLFSEDQIRTAFIALTSLMILVLVVLLLLISARPQGRIAPYDTTQFRATVDDATAGLEGYRELGSGRVQLDIDRAIELVAERGVSEPFTATATTGPEDEGAAAAGEAAQGAELPDGSQVYGSCVACHQANGEGVPGAFPPLAGHAADLYEADPAYLAQVVTFGLQGPITVEGNQYNGLMPAWDSFSDAQIAAVLNYILSSWGNEEVVSDAQPYSSDFIAEQRALELTPNQVHERRQTLELP